MFITERLNSNPRNFRTRNTRRNNFTARNNYNTTNTPQTMDNILTRLESSLSLDPTANTTPIT